MNGEPPGVKAVWTAVNSQGTPRKKLGRPLGSLNTTKEEDKQIVATMLKIRGPNDGGLVDAPMVHAKLPTHIKDKVGPDTVRLRLNEAGYFMSEKSTKDAVESR